MLRLALIGFGNVGQGFASVLQTHASLLRSQYGLEVSVVAVSTASRGSVYHPDGLDLETVLDVAAQRDMSLYPHSDGLQYELDSLTIIKDANADIVIETTPTELTRGEPALVHLRTAFEHGKHVITTNKAPLVLAYRDLAALAARQGLYWGFEGTVMAGTPALRLARQALAGCQISGLSGILNGTTNFMLTNMEQGMSYTEALAQAQHYGYAEADPTGDVEGYDAVAKLAIIINTVLDVPYRMDQVERQGITQLTKQHIDSARAAGERWKLIASAQVTSQGVVASITPQRLPMYNPLAMVQGVQNAITYQTDLLGPVTLSGTGAGRRETGFAILSDLLDLYRLHRR